MTFSGEASVPDFLEARCISCHSTGRKLLYFAFSGAVGNGISGGVKPQNCTQSSVRTTSGVCALLLQAGANVHCGKDDLLGRSYLACLGAGYAHV